jgi:CRP-like cAMP-binding protein
VLSGTVRKRVMPIVDVEPLAEKVRYANNMIKSRPRDLEDTLAQLVHDDDPVVAAAAVTFIRQRNLWNLAADLAYIGERRTADPLVIEAAAWALANREGFDDAGGVWPWVPVVEVADRLRAASLFSVLSVDELFRIAESTRQVRHEPGRVLAEAGTAPTEVQFLVEGVVQLTAPDGAVSTVQAPTALGFEEVLEGRPLSHTASAWTPVVCLVVKADEFLTMLSDNIALARGVFRLLLASRSRGVWVSTPAADLAAGGREIVRTPSDAPAGSALDKALRLRQTPLLARATVEQLLALAAIARNLRFASGSVLMTEADPPAIVHVLSGRLRIDQDGKPVGTVVAGGTLGVAETLASDGDSSHLQITAESDGEALRIDRDALFEVVAEHRDLMQGLFSSVLRAGGVRPGSNQGQTEVSPAVLAQR